MSKIRGVKKKLSTFRKTLYSVLFALGFATISSCAGGYEPLSSRNLRTTTSDTTSYVQVGEIWDSTNKTFNKDNVNILMKYISGNAGATISDLDTLAETSSSYGSIYDGYSSANMRANTLSAGTEGSVSYVAKSSSQDVQVKLGGLEWECVYLSKDKSGNTILTLWLDNCQQDAFNGGDGQQGEYYGYSDEGFYSYFASYFSDYSDTYWESMYGTSYIRAVTLNNGGTYATSGTATSSWPQKETSPFALYTMSQYGLTDYLVTPRNVSWQEMQSAKTILGESYNLPNDAWSSSMTSGFYTLNYNKNYYLVNFASKTGNDYWADDYLWLPSVNETGYYDDVAGLWETSTDQRANRDGSWETDLTQNAGTLNEDDYMYTYSLLRSVYYDEGYMLYNLFPSGDEYNDANPCYAFAVRPALHLNLTAVVNGVDNSTYVQVGELYDEDTDSINYTNLDIMYKYLTGNANATYATVTKSLNLYNSSCFRSTTLSAGTHNGTEYSAKKAGQDVVVRLGGLDWYVVGNDGLNGTTYLTFYLKGGGQEKWLDSSTYTSTAGEYYGFIDGVLYADWSANFQSTNTSNAYPSNMYGTSYMNAVVLNNGGIYATNTTTGVTATQNSSNPFALYTMASGGLTKYLCVADWDEETYETCGLGGDTIFEQYCHPNEQLVRYSYSDVYATILNEKYISKANYSDWGSSYLWLPSALHTTHAWQLSDAQQANGDLTDSFAIMGTVGTKSENAYASSWLRTGHGSRAYMAYTMLADGSSYGTSGVGSAHAVRPALYFNLTAVEADRPSTASISTQSLGEKILEANSYVCFANALFERK